MDKCNYNASSATIKETNSPQTQSNKFEEMSSNHCSSSSLNSNATKRSRSPSVNDGRNCKKIRKESKNVSKKSKSELKSKTKSKSKKGSTSRIAKKKKAIFTDSEDEEKVIENSERINNTDDNNQEESKKENCIDIVNDENPTEPENFISDFDAMMLRKKSERTNRRKRQDIDLINDNDDTIDKLIQSMKAAAEEDRVLNKHSQPATKKISMLKQVMSQLIKKDLQLAFIEHNILNVLADWLAPLPNKSLPCFQIREGILKLLSIFPTIDKYYLKQSGIGKAVMYLFKHPQEIKANRDRAGCLISDWMRPIFNLSVDSISREERQNRDLQHIPRTKRSNSPGAENRKKDGFGSSLVAEENTSGSYDKGRIQRASVPIPSNNVYIVRPKSSINVDINTTTKNQSSRYEKYVKRFIKAKNVQNSRRPVQISIEGRKMSL